jgi:hypothetical protein
MGKQGLEIDDLRISIDDCVARSVNQFGVRVGKRSATPLWIS